MLPLKREREQYVKNANRRDQKYKEKNKREFKG